MGHPNVVVFDVKRANLAILRNEGGEDVDEGPGCLADEGRLNVLFVVFSDGAEEQTGECLVHVSDVVVLHLMCLPGEAGDFSAAGCHGIGEGGSVWSRAGHSYWRWRVMGVVCRVERYEEVSERGEIRFYAACTAA